MKAPEIVNKQAEELKVLKPCPFCGGKAREELARGMFEGYRIYHIYCQGCGSSSPNVKIWNMRITQEGK